jgi:DUF4097 and DUF4098 domain-containing protein YvlB
MSHYSFEVNDDATLELRVSAGRIDLTAAGGREISIDVSGNGADFIVAEQNGNTITVREERHLWGNRSVSIRAAVPVGTNLELALAAADLLSRVDLGRVTGKTASGDIDLGRVTGLELRTASGDVKVDTCTGTCEFGSASGNLRVHNVEGDIRASTASGDVDVERTAGRLEIKTASGDINIRSCFGESLEAGSMSGDIHLGVPEGTRVEAEIDSLSGEVRLPTRRPPGTDSVRQMRLRAKTVSGDIELRRVRAGG